MEKLIRTLPINKTEKLLLYVLVEMEANKQAVSITYDKLTEYCGSHRNSIGPSMKNLIELGYISVEKGHGKAANAYRVTL